MSVINHNLLTWFADHKRDLIFRQHKNPYYIWVSEVMLQQTRVAAMLASFEKFISRFTNIASLAQAEEQEVLQYWQGLGYYSRAIHLRKGAIYVQNQCNGRFPDSLDDALKIPGVGPYTARAVISIAYDKPFAVVDGNVKRVLARLFTFEKPIDVSRHQKELQQLADSILDKNHAGDFNQAMMELGATICQPKPDCPVCPIKSDCRAFAENQMNNFPKISPKKAKIDLQMDLYFLLWQGKVLLIKDRARKFFKTIYSLPFTTLEAGQLCQPPYWQELLAQTTTPLPVVSGIAHSITNFRIHANVYQVHFQKNPRQTVKNLEIQWIQMSQLEQTFTSSLAGKILKKLNQAGTLWQ